MIIEISMTIPIILAIQVTLLSSQTTHQSSDEVIIKENIISSADGDQTIRLDFFRNDKLIMDETRVINANEIIQKNVGLYDSNGEKKQLGMYWRVGFDMWANGIRSGIPGGMMVDFQGDGAVDMIVLEAGNQRVNWFFVERQNEIRPIPADLYRLAMEKGNDWLIKYLSEDPTRQPNALELIIDGITVKNSGRVDDNGTGDKELQFFRGDARLLVEITRVEKYVAKSRRVEIYHPEESEPRLIWEIDMVSGLTVRNHIDASYTDIGDDGVFDLITISNDGRGLVDEYFVILSPSVVRPIPDSLLLETRKNGTDWLYEEGLLRMTIPSHRYLLQK